MWNVHPHLQLWRDHTSHHFILCLDDCKVNECNLPQMWDCIYMIECVTRWYCITENILSSFYFFASQTCFFVLFAKVCASTAVSLKWMRRLCFFDPVSVWIPALDGENLNISIFVRNKDNDDDDGIVCSSSVFFFFCFPASFWNWVTSVSLCS